MKSIKKMAGGTGYPVNRRASGANSFTPALNNITGKRVAKGSSLVFKPNPYKKPAPMKDYPTRGNKSVFKKK